jgi:hypothetical protein
LLARQKVEDAMGRNFREQRGGEPEFNESKLMGK